MKKVSIFKVIGCFALALCTSLCAVLAVGCSGNKVEKTADGGLVVTPGNQNEMISLLAGPTKDSSGNFLSEYTLTVKFNDDCPEDMKLIDWSFDWKDPNADWVVNNKRAASGYISVTPTSDGAATAVVKFGGSATYFSKTFSEQIIITATSRIRPDLKATATVDCLKRFDMMTNNNFVFSSKNEVVVFGQPLSFDITVDDSQADGTIGNTRAEADYVSVNNFVSDIIASYSLTDSVKAGPICNGFSDFFVVGTVLSMDSFLKCEEESIKETIEYKRAFNDVLDYLKNNDITCHFGPSLYYNDIMYCSRMVGLYAEKSFRIDVSSLTPYDIVTSVAFTDSAIIF